MGITQTDFIIYVANNRQSYITWAKINAFLTAIPQITTANCKWWNVVRFEFCSVHLQSWLEAMSIKPSCKCELILPGCPGWTLQQWMTQQWYQGSRYRWIVPLPGSPQSPCLQSSPSNCWDVSGNTLCFIILLLQHNCCTLYYYPVIVPFNCCCCSNPTYWTQREHTMSLTWPIALVEYSSH